MATATQPPPWPGGPRLPHRLVLSLSKCQRPRNPPRADAPKRPPQQQKRARRPPGPPTGRRRACRPLLPDAEAAPSRPRTTQRSDTVPLPPARPPELALSEVEGAKSRGAYLARGLDVRFRTECRDCDTWATTLPLTLTASLRSGPGRWRALAALHSLGDPHCRPESASSRATCVRPLRLPELPGCS